MKRLCLIITIIFTFGMIPLGLSLAEIIDCDYACDAIWQQIPFIVELKKMFFQHPWGWSWNTFLGDNFIGGYSYYGIFSPFNIFCYLFPAPYMHIAFLISVYLMTLGNAICAYLYFSRMHVSENSSILGGVLYAFSSFYIINFIYCMFYVAMMLFPLLLICIENSLDRKRYSFALLSIVSFLTVILQYYSAVSSFICAGIYLICRVTCNRNYRTLRNLMTPLSAIVYGIIMSAAVLLPTGLHIVGGNRGGFDEPISFASSINAAISHIFWAIIPKIGQMAVPSFMFGIDGSISLFIQIFGPSLAIIYSFVKKDWIATCLLVFTIIYITPINGIFSLFTSFFYCRWGYCFILLIILATIKCIDEDIITRRRIILYLIFAFTMIAFMVGLCQSFLWRSGRLLSLNNREIIELTIGIIGLFALWWLVFDSKRLNKYSMLAVSISSIINMSCAIYMLSGNPIIAPQAFNTTYKTLADCIVNNPIPYNTNHKFANRTDIVIQNFLNTSLLKNTPGITCYHSLYNKNIIDFAEYISDGPIKAYAVIRTPRESLGALLSVRDIIRFNFGPIGDSDYNFGLTFKEKLGRHDKYSFDYYIPMGMVYDSYITRSQLDSLRSADKDADLCLMMLDNIVIEDRDEPELGKVLRKSRIDTAITLDSIAAMRRRHTTDFKGDSKGYTIATHDDTPQGMIFISTPCDEGFTATIDGKPTKIYRVNMGMSGIIVPPGKHFIEASYLTPGLKLGAIISGIMMTLLLIYFLMSYRRYRNIRYGSMSR